MIHSPSVTKFVNVLIKLVKSLCKKYGRDHEDLHEFKKTICSMSSDDQVVLVQSWYDATITPEAKEAFEEHSGSWFEVVPPAIAKLHLASIWKNKRFKSKSKRFLWVYLEQLRMHAESAFMGETFDGDLDDPDESDDSGGFGSIASLAKFATFLPPKVIKKIASSIKKMHSEGGEPKTPQETIELALKTFQIKDVADVAMQMTQGINEESLKDSKEFQELSRMIREAGNSDEKEETPQTAEQTLKAMKDRVSQLEKEQLKAKAAADAYEAVLLEDAKKKVADVKEEEEEKKVEIS